MTTAEKIHNGEKNARNTTDTPEKFNMMMLVFENGKKYHDIYKRTHMRTRFENVQIDNDV